MSNEFKWDDLCKKLFMIVLQCLGDFDTQSKIRLHNIAKYLSSKIRLPP